MATVARPAPAGAGGSSGIKVALIVFVCLTVASLAGTVILYTQQADLQAAADEGDRKSQNANKAVSDMRQGISEIARKMTGEPSEDVEKLKKELETRLQPVVADERLKSEGITADSTVVSVLSSLYKAYANTSDLLAKNNAEREELNQKLAALNEKVEARIKEFADKTDEFQKKYADLEKQSQSNQTAWNAQVEELKKKLEGASAAASTQLRTERQARQKLEQQLAQKDIRFKEMADKLAQFSPTGGSAASLDAPDGTVVRAIPGEGIVYISLGKRDRIRPGMPFSVYSAIKGVGQREKATIEVVNVFDDTCECRVTSGELRNPILAGDLIANVVYDKTRQFNFVVVGDFDLNFDGKVDDVSGQKVAEMITKWGGNILSGVDTQVDFVVLGNPPVPAVKPLDTDDAAAKQRAAEQTELIKAFQATESEARALSIPILTRTQFMHLLGLSVPKNAELGEQAAM